MNIKVTMDSACDLPRELLERYGIGVLPMTIVHGDKAYKDGAGFTPDELFGIVEKGGACTTTAINTSEYEEYFAACLRGCDAVIHINLSGEISSCHQNAVIAAEGKPVYAIDSRSLSSGSGILAVEAAEAAENGAGAEEIARRLGELSGSVETSFVIDTLKYLHRGGRCSGLAALGANILKLKPCIEMTDGKMNVGRKYRGNIDTVILQYVKDKLAGRRDIDCRRIFMTHTLGVAEETLARVRETILECGPFEAIYDTPAGCTISNHSGPGTLGVLYIGTRRFAC
ncbi:MAG: DegV family protein [Oscillospiraceae bacterium]|jgi:DegV family protein with EDD domain|nr:DegV family protein [Oscillospiraceae bacterium]